MDGFISMLFLLPKPLNNILDKHLDAFERRRKRDLPSMASGVRWYFTHQHRVFFALTVASFLAFCSVFFIAVTIMEDTRVPRGTITWWNHPLQPWFIGLAIFAIVAYLMRYVLHVVADGKYRKTRGTKNGTLAKGEG